MCLNNQGLFLCQTTCPLGSAKDSTPHCLHSGTQANRAAASGTLLVAEEVRGWRRGEAGGSYTCNQCSSLEVPHVTPLTSNQPECITRPEVQSYHVAEMGETENYSELHS